MVILAINDLLGDQALAQTGLQQLKLAFTRFSENKQKYPLVYDCELFSCWSSKGKIADLS